MSRLNSATAFKKTPRARDANLGVWGGSLGVQTDKDFTMTQSSHELQHRAEYKLFLQTRT